MGSFSMVLDTAFRCCARYSLSTRGELDKDGHRDELLFSGTGLNISPLARWQGSQPSQLKLR